jgi:hypothetical protein
MAMQSRWRRARADASRGIPMPLSVAQERQRVIVARNGIGLPVDVDRLSGCGPMPRIARSYHITVTWEPACAALNAYGFPLKREIECAPSIHVCPTSIA